ncbi:hypothetical protein HRG_000688 [Hirsutella rhossiliensis]|uniref:Uncharacterized protein n=1 Tax=Hirsutella rhossiliensis TaxID=111463 RepID=A0A9P8SPB7_9HYPO|nr:uncharacterized protein HRG_00688 [Hirsutella rhossiliensis]KAH0968046.1 hypothetical protein HRG_00688 [Hirsutella rhossiliensis]
MLLCTSSPRRALPRPPTTVTAPDGSIVATPLSPRPRDNSSSNKARMPSPCSVERKLSASSSSYSMAPSVSVAGGSPSRCPTSRSAREQQYPQTLGNTIAELRRMNSMVSSYSAASVASTAVGGGVDMADSPTLPSLFSGGVAAAAAAAMSQAQGRPMPRPSAIGSRHYLNIGNSPPKHRPHHHRKSASADGRSAATAAARPSSDRDRLLLQHQQRRDSLGKEQQHGKENQGLEVLKAPRVDGGPPPVPGLKNPRRSANREMRVPLPGSCTVPLSPATVSASAAPAAPAAPAGIRQKLVPGPVKNLAVAFEKRIADGRQGRVDGLGRRERDGSPATLSSDGESRKRCPRM